VSDGLALAAFVARDYHGGQWTGLYALSCGDYSLDTLNRAGSELSAAINHSVTFNDDDADIALAAIDAEIARLEAGAP
jgi:hypothetical protein